MSTDDMTTRDKEWALYGFGVATRKVEIEAALYGLRYNKTLPQLAKDLRREYNEYKARLEAEQAAE